MYIYIYIYVSYVYIYIYIYIDIDIDIIYIYIYIRAKPWLVKFPIAHKQLREAAAHEIKVIETTLIKYNKHENDNYKELPKLTISEETKRS